MVSGLIISNLLAWSASLPRELSLLLQYFSENNVIIDTVTLNKINDFLSLISPDIESIFGRIYLAKKSLQELPKK